MNRQLYTAWNAFIWRTLTLYLFTTESHKSTVSGLLAPNRCMMTLNWRPHNDRHPQPVHEARLRVRAKRGIGKNSLWLKGLFVLVTIQLYL